MSNGTKQTIVEDGTQLKGTLSSTCPIVVRGRIEGDIETPTLLVSENGAVHGRAKVGTLRSQGELAGEFDADVVELAGRVKDNTVIRTRSLEVKLTSEESKLQVTFEDCELAVGDAPTDDAALGKNARGVRGGKRDGKSDPVTAAPPVTGDPLT
ncbi:MAG TPA: polymer-forming cytoskeletal protein [Polyangiaceae bacterium]|nr:polymer-forming cytoskeletal protein [Polyangiaceae bacterium]